MPLPPRPRRPRRIVLAAAVAACLAWAVGAFGLSGNDAAALLAFTQGVDRWQADPEFRAVAFDYSVRGSAAMRSRPLLLPADRVILFVRSAPLLPRRYAVNPTSRLHYQNFSRGPLCAYLHLCSEQDVPPYLDVLERLARDHRTGDADLADWLAGIRMDFPVVRDAGAVQSAAALVADTDPARPFAVRGRIPPLLAPHIDALARGLGFPPDPADMTPDQQRAVLDRLDSYVRLHDPELWRTKQVSDFCGGIWAQVFGPPYNRLLVPVLAVHTACRVLLVMVLGGGVVGRLRRKPGSRGAEPEATGNDETGK